VVLISIKPKYVDLIMAGKKRYELRRGGSTVQAGDTLLLYSTSPEKAVVATCDVKRTLSDTPSRIRRTVNSGAGIGEKEYAQYFKGASRATAFELGRIKSLSVRPSLKDLKKLWGNPKVPRSYRFLSDKEVCTLKKWLNGGIPGTRQVLKRLRPQ